jgi:hypothetical protein
MFSLAVLVLFIRLSGPFSLLLVVSFYVLKERERERERERKKKKKKEKQVQKRGPDLKDPTIRTLSYKSKTKRKVIGLKAQKQNKGRCKKPTERKHFSKFTWIHL